MFDAEMVAPCGLDCSLCAQALKKENPCPGCNGGDEFKPEFCSTRCQIINCEHLPSLHGDYCDACSQYPCEHLKEREYRYMNQYPLPESPTNNLKMIREKGMAYFLESQKEKWSCLDCGGIISVHTGLCSKCHKNYGRKTRENPAWWLSQHKPDNALPPFHAYRRNNSLQTLSERTR